MVRKLALWVCPQVNCPSCALKSNDCPKHKKALVRRVYKLDESLTGADNNLADVFAKFGDAFK